MTEPPEGTRFHSVDLFSGIGGNAYAFRNLATPVLYCEIMASARIILQSAMHANHIHTAPIHDDVTTLRKSPQFERAKQMRPLLISGSWPCQGNSTLGLRKGMDDPRSGLIRSLCDALDDAKPEVFFVENTPSVITNGQLQYLRDRMAKHYSISWGKFSAEDAGFPHVRQRFFAVGVLRGYKVDLPPGAEVLEHLLPAAVEPARMTLAPQFGRVPRLHALGNGVVPAVSLYAFLTLLKVDITQPRAARPLQIVLNPACYSPPADLRISKLVRADGLLTEPMTRARWSTPRAGMHGACHVLTARSCRDLPTMVRFAEDTPDELRSGYMSVAWNEYLMGPPVGYTAVTDKELMEQLECAPQDPRTRAARPPRARVHHDDEELQPAATSQPATAKRHRAARDGTEVLPLALSGEQSRSVREARRFARSGDASEAILPM